MGKFSDSINEQQVATTCLVVLTIIAVGATLAPLRPVLVPLLLAVLFSYCLRPVIDWQERKLKVPRSVALFGAAIVALAVLGLLALAVFGFVTAARENLPVYEQRFKDLIVQVGEDMPLNQIGLRLEGGDWTVSSETKEWLLRGMFSSATDILSASGLVLIFVLFILAGSKGENSRSKLLAEIEVRVRRYLMQMFGFSVATGLLVWASLAIVGVDFAFAFGFLAFLFNFIPTVGPLVATFLPLPVVLLDPSLSIFAKVMAFALPGAVQCAFAVIQPRAQGEAQDLHPVTAMAALVFFGSIWGIIGAALAVPLTGVIKIILERIPDTKLIAAWMAGKFNPLTEPPPDEMPAPLEKHHDHV